jgi:hypothetical protein
MRKTLLVVPDRLLVQLILKLHQGYFELLLMLFLEFFDLLFLLVYGLDLFGLERVGNSPVAEVLFLEAFVVFEQQVLGLLGQRGPILLHDLVLPV